MTNPFKVELPMSSVFIKYTLFGWNILLFILGIALAAIGFGVSLEYAANKYGAKFSRAHFLHHYFLRQKTYFTPKTHFRVILA